LNHEKKIKMIIEKNDLKAFLREARLEHEIGADSVFCEDRVVKLNDLHFCMGGYDEALFRHETYDYERYSSYSVRTLYEATTLIYRKMVPPEEYIVKDPHHGRELIDLGNFVQKRETIHQLHRRMKHADWYYEYADDPQAYRYGEASFSSIKKDLLWLSKQVNGKSLANELWTMYAPPHSLARPEFLKESVRDTAQSQQSSHDQEQASQIKSAQNQRHQSKKIKRPRQQRPRL
jgi:hypothetical protein